MSTITIKVSDKVKMEAEEAARSVHLSLSNFARLALVQSLTHPLKDPRLKERAKMATGRGWNRLKRYIPNVPPIPGDERL